MVTPWWTKAGFTAAARRAMGSSHSRWRRRPLPPNRRATYHPPPSVDRTRHTGCISSIAQAMTRAK